MIFIEELRKWKPKSTYLYITGYMTEQGQVADYGLLQMNYGSLIRRSIVQLDSLTISNDLESKAKSELLVSLHAKIEKEKEKEKEPDCGFDYLLASDQDRLPDNVWIGADGDCYVSGLCYFSRIVVAGHYREVKSKPLTIAKRKLEKQLDIGKFKQFKLSDGKVGNIKVVKLWRKRDTHQQLVKYGWSVKE